MASASRAMIEAELKELAAAQGFAGPKKLWSEPSRPGHLYNTHSLEKDFKSWNLAAIAMRLRVPEGSTLPFEFIAAHPIDETKVVVFVVQNKQAIIIEDDGPLFPSDTLITKLRLIQEKK